MSHLLQIDASPRRERSHSRQLTREFVDQWRQSHPGGAVTYRDLGHHPAPLIDEDWIAAAATPATQRTPQMEQTLRVSEELIAELLAADILVFGVPMYNFGIPAGLKAYIDQVVRAGRTFSTANFAGLATGKRAFVLMSAGQQYGAGGPTESMNHVEPYLRTVFGFIGITDVTFVPVVTGSGDQVLAQSYQSAQAQIRQFAGESSLAA